LEIGHPLLFDVPFSSTHYHLSNNNQKVDIKCSSVHVNPIYEDFHHYPVARMPYISITLQKDWQHKGVFNFGIISITLKTLKELKQLWHYYDYTPEGFAINTKGVLLHNGNYVGTTNMNYSNTLVTLICDSSISLLHVVVGNQRHDYWPHYSNSPNIFPKEVYFSFLSPLTVVFN
jgi:hypothetical protein